MNATKAFFHQFLTVVGQLQEMFPDDPDFPTFLTFLNLLQKTNPSVVINTFYENVNAKYEKKINEKDDAFIAGYEGTEYGSDMVDIFSKVKGYWSVMSPETKASIWQYMYVLKELCKRAYVVPA